LHEQLLALEKYGVTLGLKHGSVSTTYQALIAEGRISIKVRIAVTPHATLYVEHRYIGVCEKVKTKNNVFNQEIQLHRGQEWVYYRTEIDAGHEIVRRYFRLNIISKQEQELSREDFVVLITRP
ncbi:MAG: hypothetical protein DRP45_05260, partial [Candidatus Zixiibacteriota bacterium]